MNHLGYVHKNILVGVRHLRTLLACGELGEMIDLNTQRFKFAVCDDHDGDYAEVYFNTEIEFLDGFESFIEQGHLEHCDYYRIADFIGHRLFVTKSLSNLLEYMGQWVESEEGKLRVEELKKLSEPVLKIRDEFIATLNSMGDNENA